MKKVAIAGALLMSVAGFAQAEQAQSGPRFVLGGALSLDTSNFVDELDDDLSGPGVDVDEGDSFPIGVDLYAGLGFMEASSVRIGYRKFGQQSADVTFAGLGKAEAELDADGVYAAVDLMFPISDTFYLGATVGMQSWDVELDAGGSRDSEDGSDLFYGVRGKFLFSEKNGALTLSLNRYAFDLPGTDLEYVPVAVGVEFFL